MVKKSELIGKTLLSILLNEDRDTVTFITAEGEFSLTVSGDCCSESWIESVEDPALGYPAKVLSINDLELGGEEKPTTLVKEYWQGSIAYYGCEIVTDKGSITIDYRNDSNGYYGGSLCWGYEGSLN